MRLIVQFLFLLSYMNLFTSIRFLTNRVLKPNISMKLSSPKIPTSSKVSKIKSSKLREFMKPVIEFSNNQQKYYDSLISPNVSLIVAIGPAGSGKTLIACQSAIKALLSKTIQKIIITRPIVSVDEELGFLPGTFEAKMDPWTRPVFDILRESFTSSEIQNMMDSGSIEISPLAYMRGRTFKKSFIIADEMQNSSPNQMKMILTRIGEGSKMVITGDLFQSDRDGENGLSDFMIRYNDSPVSSREISCIELDKCDVRRSSIVSTILDIYEPEFNKPTSSIIDDIVIDDVIVDIDDSALIPRKWNKDIDL